MAAFYTHKFYNYTASIFIYTCNLDICYVM